MPNRRSSSSCTTGTIKTNLPLPIQSGDEMTTTAEESSDGFPPPPSQPQHHAHYIHHSHFQQDVGLPHYKLHDQKLPTIYSGPPTTSENNTESESDDECPGSSSSECGECCGGHAPYPSISPRPANIIPATMCKGTQISPTTVIEMYAASVRRTGSLPRPNGGLHPVPCPTAPPLHTSLPCPRHGSIGNASKI